MAKIPALSAKEMAELDRRLVEDFHMDLLMMMENAGRSLANQARMMMMGTVEEKKILVMAGKGNNGGGGLVCARNLHNWGAEIEVILASPPSSLREAPRKQLDIIQRMGIIVHTDYDGGISSADLIIDALLGYNQKGNPRGAVAELIRMANSSGTNILALDVPSGLDLESGDPNKPCIHATQTLTLALPKTGLLKKQARLYTGRIFLADISVPRGLYREFKVTGESIFANDSIVELS